MSRIIPVGARVFVEDLEPEVSLVKRAAAAGLHAVVLEENVPKPTSGRVVAVGTDPLIQELCSVGDVVTFSRLAGTYQQVDGKEYRALDYRELIGCIKPDSSQAPQQSGALGSEPTPDPDC